MQARTVDAESKKFDDRNHVHNILKFQFTFTQTQIRLTKESLKQ